MGFVRSTPLRSRSFPLSAPAPLTVTIRPDRGSRTAVQGLDVKVVIRWR